MPCDASIVFKTATNCLKQPVTATVCDNFPTVRLDGEYFMVLIIMLFSTYINSSYHHTVQHYEFRNIFKKTPAISSTRIG